MDRYVRVEYGHGFERLEVYRTNEQIQKKDLFNKILIGENKTDDEEIERISLSRTKRNIREIALCNDFEYFATFTINRKSCNRTILTECQDILKQNLKKYKRKNSSFGYLFITEKHTIQEGFHFHGFIKGIDTSNLIRYTNDDFDLSLGNKLPYKLIQSIKRGDIIYHFDLFDNVGYNTLSPIRDYVACCTYIQKYITKDCVRNEHNQIYISSRGLKKAYREELMPFDLDQFNFKKFSKSKNMIVDSVYENDFCKYVDLFPNSDLNEKQKLAYSMEVIPRKEFYKTHIDF